MSHPLQPALLRPSATGPHCLCLSSAGAWATHHRPLAATLFPHLQGSLWDLFKSASEPAAPQEAKKEAAPAPFAAPKPAPAVKAEKEAPKKAAEAKPSKRKGPLPLWFAGACSCVSFWLVEEG